MMKFEALIALSIVLLFYIILCYASVNIPAKVLAKKGNFPKAWGLLIFIPIISTLTILSIILAPAYKLPILLTCSLFQTLHLRKSLRPFLKCYDSISRMKDTELKRDFSGSWKPLSVPPDSPSMSGLELLAWTLTSKTFFIILMVLCVSVWQVDLWGLFDSAGNLTEGRIQPFVNHRLMVSVPSFVGLTILLAAILNIFGKRKIRFRFNDRGTWDVLSSPGFRNLITSGTRSHIKKVVITKSTLNVAWYRLSGSRTKLIKVDAIERHIHTFCVDVVLAGDPDVTLPIAHFPEDTLPINDTKPVEGVTLIDQSTMPRGTWVAFNWPGFLPLLVFDDIDHHKNEESLARARDFCYKLVPDRARVKEIFESSHEYLNTPVPIHPRITSMPFQAFLNERLRPLSTYFRKSRETQPSGSSLNGSILSVVRRVLHTVTNVASIGMIATYILAFSNLASAIREPLVLSWEQLTGHVSGHTDDGYITSALHAIELMILAPLPYLLMLGLSRYIDAVTSGKDTKKAKAELLDFKAFEVALLISAISTILVSRFLFYLVPQKESRPISNVEVWLLVVAIMAISVLALYYFKLERNADDEQEHVKANPSDVLPFEQHAEHLRRQDRFKEAAEVYEQAGTFVLANSRSMDDPRGIALLAEGELCAIKAAIESEDHWGEKEARASFAEHIYNLLSREGIEGKRFAKPVIISGIELGISARQMGVPLSKILDADEIAFYIT